MSSFFLLMDRPELHPTSSLLVLPPATSPTLTESWLKFQWHSLKADWSFSDSVKRHWFHWKLTEVTVTHWNFTCFTESWPRLGWCARPLQVFKINSTLLCMFYLDACPASSSHVQQIYWNLMWLFHIYLLFGFSSSCCLWGSLLSDFAVLNFRIWDGGLLLDDSSYSVPICQHKFLKWNICSIFKIHFLNFLHFDNAHLDVMTFKHDWRNIKTDGRRLTSQSQYVLGRHDDREKRKQTWTRREYMKQGQTWLAVSNSIYFIHSDEDSIGIS